MLKLALCLQVAGFTLLGGSLVVLNCGGREQSEVKAIRSTNFRPSLSVQAAGIGIVFFVAVDGSARGRGT
jgi:hypothetical protein